MTNEEIIAEKCQYCGKPKEEHFGGTLCLNCIDHFKPASQAEKKGEQMKAKVYVLKKPNLDKLIEAKSEKQICKNCGKSKARHDAITRRCFNNTNSRFDPLPKSQEERGD